MIIAQYTIRSKQEYIFRTNKAVDIVGASANISKAWNILFEEAEGAGIVCRRLSEDDDFCLAEVKKDFDSGLVGMVELFCGGGNETVLVDCVESYRKINQAFSYRLLNDYPGMIPMAVYAEVTGDYAADYRALMESAENKKNVMVPGRDEFLVPFAMMDRTTYQPLVTVVTERGFEERLTAESEAKRSEGLKQRDANVRILDNLVTKRGEESLLAIVHADGNNMGLKIQRMLKDRTDYDFCVTMMRRFTKRTAEVFRDRGIAAVNDCRIRLKNKYKGKFRESAFLFRLIVADGDDITFICNARFAAEYAKAYLTAVEEYDGGEWRYSSCAGICVFHSHYPFARAYELADQCTDSAKQVVHEAGGSKEEGWVDFHFIHSGIGGDLEEIQKRQGTGVSMARPWRICSDEDAVGDRDYKKMEEVARILREKKVARTSIKTIGSKWEYSHEDGRKEYYKLCGHNKGLRNALADVYGSETELLKVMYDLAEMYDLWFVEVK